MARTHPWKASDELGKRVEPLIPPALNSFSLKFSDKGEGENELSTSQVEKRQIILDLRAAISEKQWP